MANPLTPSFDKMTGTIGRAVNAVIDQDFPGLTHGEKMRLLTAALAHECGLVIATIGANEDLELSVIADIAGRAAVEVGKAARLTRLPNTPMIFDFRDMMKAKP
jgi:hypothetical protein